MGIIKTKVVVDEDALQDRINQIIQDSAVGQEIHTVLAKMCDPYVPMKTGTLAYRKLNVTPNFVQYEGPYAHYMYEGMIYGPNIPIYENIGATKVITGYFSIPGKAKSPTGRYMTYSQEMHPLASRHWDKEMMRNNGDAFVAEVKRILSRRLNNGQK